MTSKRAFKNYVLSHFDMDFVGIADSSLLETEPAGHRPSDYLPTAKAVIVFGRRMIDGAVQSTFRVFEDRHIPSQTSYADHAHYLAVNMLLLQEIYNLAQYIERTYCANATPLPNNALQDIEPDGLRVPYFADPYQAGMPIDLAKAAVAAGLGEIGWSHRFMTPDDGPRVHLCAIITDMEFDELDKPYSGPKLCDPSKCNICTEGCPTQAISAYEDGAEPTEVAGTKQTMCKLNAKSCTVACMGMGKQFNPRAGYISPSNDPSDEELAAGIKKLESAPGLMMLDHLPSFYCDKCLVYCPVGSWEQKYRSRGLTKK